MEALPLLLVVLLAPFMLVAVTAPIGATILGFAAISRIRHSQGKLHGLGFALFGALLWPLLLLDALIGVALSVLFATLGQIALGVALDHTWSGVLLATVLVSVVVDFFIVRWAWRKVNQPSAVGQPSPKARSSATNVWPRVLLTVAWHAVLFLLATAFFVFWVPRFVQVLMDFGAALPPATLVVIKLSDLLRRAGLFLIPCLMLLDLGICYLLRRHAPRAAQWAWSGAVVVLIPALVLLSGWQLQRTIAIERITALQPSSAPPTIAQVERSLSATISTALHDDGLRWNALSVLVAPDLASARVGFDKLWRVTHAGPQEGVSPITNATLRAAKLHGTDWLIRGSGQLRHLSFVADASFTPGPVQRARTIPGPTYTLVSEADGFYGARLSDGTVIELVGLSYHPSAGATWWRPDGTVMAEPPYYNDVDFWAGPEPGTVGYEIAYRVLRQPGHQVRSHSCGLPGNRGQGFFHAKDHKGGESAPNISHSTVRYPADTRTVTVNLGAAVDPWRTAATTIPQRPLVLTRTEFGYLAIDPAETRDGRLWLHATLATNWDGVAWQLVAHDRRGQRQLLQMHDVADAPVDGQFRRRYAFCSDRVALPEVREIRLETARFEHVEFRNVSLRPGEKTAVGVALATTSAAAAAGQVASKPPLTDLAVQQQPRLRFLAWQDDNLDPNTPRAWYPDGSLVTNAAGLRLLRYLDPTRLGLGGEPKDTKILNLWFSHPAIDKQSTVRVDLLGPDGKRLPSLKGDRASQTREAEPNYDNCGWITIALSPGRGEIPPAGALELRFKTAIPSTVDVVLEYSAGPWTDRPDAAAIPVDFSGHMGLGDGVYFNGGIGQGADGKTFLTIVRDGTKTTAIQHDFVAITKDGRRLARTGWGLGGPPNLLSEEFRFDVPLAEIKTFQLRTRPVRTVTYRNVSLWPGYAPGALASATDAVARLVISIERGGRITPDGVLFTLDGEVLGGAGITTNSPYDPLADLQARLKQMLARQPDLSVVIAADRDVPYNRVAKALDAAKQAGAKKVWLETTATAPGIEGAAP